MYTYTPHPDLSLVQAEPINGTVITPMSDDWDDHCEHCAHPIKVVPRMGNFGGYWFHTHTKEKYCLRRDLGGLAVEGGTGS